MRGLLGLITFVAATALALAVDANADPALKLHRGVPTDIWLTWPEDDRLNDTTLLSVYPEWRQKFGAAQYKSAKQAGFDFVRLTVDPAPFLFAPSEEKTRKLMAGVVQMVHDIRKQELNVLVDMHAIPQGTRSVGSETYVASDKAFAAYVDLIRQFAVALADEDPAHVGFEPFNEPVLDCDLSEGQSPRWPAMLAALHKAFRASNTTLTLVLSGACWGSAYGLKAIDPATFHDDNIIWSFHSYEPFLVSHQGASWSDGPTQYVDGVSYPPRRSEKSAVLTRALKRIKTAKLSPGSKAELISRTRDELAAYYAPGAAHRKMQEPFTDALAWGKAHGIPPQRMLLGEFGCIYQDSYGETPIATRAAMMDGIRRLAEQSGMAWSTWSWGGSFRLTRDEQQTLFYPELLEALGLAH